MILIAITLDDFTAAADIPQQHQTLLIDLRRKYKVKYLGIATRIIGWSITADTQKRTMHLSQPQLAQEFINKTGIQAARPSRSPYNPRG